VTGAESKLDEAEKMMNDLQSNPVTREQLASAMKRTAASLRNTIALVCIIMAVSVAGIWTIYGSSVSAVPQSASFLWKDDQSCVYRTRYILSTGRTTTIDAEAPDAACPANPNLSSLWVRPTGSSPLPRGAGLRTLW
jgi:hypothetical protein